MTFEQQLHDDLHQHFLVQGLVDKQFPECPDVEQRWEAIAQSYAPDGIREFAQYPTASLGWMMYIGMAVARYWDDDWGIYAHIADLYTYMRDKRGYDNLDEYVRHDVLLLKGNDYDAIERLVADTAERTYAALRHQHIEPGTPEAFRAYVACLHQLYLMGMALELHHLGYHMTKLS